MNDSDAVRALSALAQESRLGVFRLLVRQGAAGMSAGDIARTLDLPPATLSFHLAQLAQAGLVESRRESRSIRYFLHVGGIRGLLDFLVQDCCGGQPELCSPGGGACCPPPSGPKSDGALEAPP